MSQIILAFDASTEALSIALKHETISNHFEVCPQEHSQKILPTIEQVLAQGNCELAALDLIAFGQGPGSFTGVRIGVSIAQGLAYAANLPVVGVSTLQIMAQEAIAKHHCDDVFVAIDARMSEIYFAHYQKNADGLAQLVGEEMVIHPEKVSLPLCSAVAVGTGWQTYPDSVARDNISVDSTIILPNSLYMLPLAEAKFNAGEATDAANAQPVYVRDTVTWQKLPGRE
ncbi:tRNA (adenosine(37)-N6)-threonylcarbamoyltransferase complex dimerization subunit type 1 TsaB [Pseudoalteromonas tunicata]|jgi:tRNA threonylcarbamoyladenosine biosynthesis protein TsaB|uniref:tRNA threonylcarbamoyladenosine biosynthesis protein TsaB n=1 Tax=Pseudoalteromonas tunicata D2 TaxID=87626 RepID=A4C469_9GAMM|nr:tRNA (adenosine(37)-N6)-threonylcarbamoyltransferase complex dimerization subunit type 1 TsaB [Pseudoalteromonas tunicata]ATC97168.1 tRNA threonylcarbamoyladenosine biosynthesis protein TsaB [Pseudoalteromonas tunicata]AXT33271.1 tRNA (adenosine(37)-N6)-threonylcarbamoyltransferase complex dimerization subunit type 1 TsaB [Pseudoalteromonas tunicata]EAR30351.1 putative protease [Pseudoalteromonas tunicata D2]MDP4984750.1 tRNA (adenosine(37)-N6)-threonylcarbamoyltransferase complex dimerizati